jgi:hypothetical protein
MQRHLIVALGTAFFLTASGVGGWIHHTTRNATPLEGPVAAVTLGPPPVAPESVEIFHERLAPYGEWIVVEGRTCWRPRVALRVGWNPYADGHWIFTDDYGWVWVTDYEWRDPYHYGRWWCTPGAGWVWVPDTVWGPCWVTWRCCDGYVGWAPLPPTDRFEPVIAVDAFVFVPSAHFLDVRLGGWICDERERVVVYEKARPILETRAQGSIVVSVGPPRPTSVSVEVAPSVRAEPTPPPARPAPSAPPRSQPPAPRPGRPGGGHR